MPRAATWRTATGLPILLIGCAGCMNNDGGECATALVSNRSKTTIVVDSIYDSRAADFIIPGTSVAYTGDGCWTSKAEPITIMIATVDGSSSVEVFTPLGGRTALLDVTLDNAGNIEVHLRDPGSLLDSVIPATYLMAD